MIDFHSHVLPCMDDGSKSVEQSIAMLRKLSEQGVSTVVATPHFYAEHESVEHFLGRREAAYAKLKGSYDDSLPQIIIGAEVRYYPGISSLSNLRDLLISGSNVLLLEMPFGKWSSLTVKEVQDIVSLGNITLVLAHVDRYMGLQPRDVWQKLYDSDVLFQANADAFKGFFSRCRLMPLVRNGMIRFIGSDCHNTSDRAPNMDVALTEIRKKLGRGGIDYLRSFGKKQLGI